MAVRDRLCVTDSNRVDHLQKGEPTAAHAKSISEKGGYRRWPHVAHEHPSAAGRVRKGQAKPFARRLHAVTSL
jgi:hypothetical protein